MVEPQAILVLGMHRSGTSSVTRILSMLGATLPARLMPAASANELGFFEPDVIVRLHDKWLKRLGSTWYDHRPVTVAGAERDTMIAQLSQAMREDFGDAPIALVKDPRICRLMPVWHHVLACVGRAPLAVLVHRPADEVAASLAARDHLPREQGLLLWLRHVLEAEFHSRSMPRFVLGYHEMLGADQGWIARLQTALPAPWTRSATDIAAEAASFVDPRLRHQTSQGDSPTMGWVATTQDAYERLASDPMDGQAMAALDGVRRGFEDACALFGGAAEGMAATRVARLRGSVVNALEARMARLKAGTASS